MPAPARVAAAPVATGEPEQLGLSYTATVVPESALPWISGELSFAGEEGLLPARVGEDGGVESSVYVTAVVPQSETSPTASVAVARRVVLELSGTDT
jgi:hypothetical protein